MRLTLLVSIVGLCAGAARAHKDVAVDLRAPGGTAWTLATTVTSRSGQMPAGGGMVVISTTVFGYTTHDGAEDVDATFVGPGGQCPRVSVPMTYRDGHYDQNCFPTFTYDGSSCASVCPTSALPPPTPSPPPPTPSPPDPELGAAAAPLAYPNPLRGPGQMNFKNLPANARVRIYSSVGLVVLDRTGGADGTMTWDGSNRGGSHVGSGVYHVVAQGEGRTYTLNIAIQR